MRTTGRARAGSVLLGCAAALAAMGLAVERGNALTVKTLNIIATNNQKGVDPRIPKAVRDVLVRTFRYTGYSLHSTADASLKVGEKVTLALPGPYRLVVQALEARGSDENRRVLLQVSIMRGEERIVGAAVSLKPGRWWLLGGPSVDGGALIVAMAVTESG